MKQELLYALAAAGALAIGRWLVLLLLRCLAGARRVRRLVFTQVVETITNPEWQERVAEETRKVVEDLDAAVNRVRGAPPPPLPLGLDEGQRETLARSMPRRI